MSRNCPRPAAVSGSAASPIGAPSLISHLHVLRTVAEAVSRSLDLNEVMQKSLAALTHVTGHEISSLHLIASDGHSLVLCGDRGLSEQLRDVNQTLPIAEGLIGRVAASGRVRLLDEVSRAPDLLPAAREAVVAAGIRGFVCVPIRARHRILGTLSLGRQTDQRFTHEEVALLECTADQIGLALDNARLYSETRRQLDELRRSQTDVVRAERLAAVGELAGGVAHEINNPLMIILGQVHLLLQGEDHETILQGLRVIDGATKRAANIVRELVLFAERPPVRRQPCQLGEQFRAVLELHEPRLAAQRIKVHAEIEDVDDVWADPSQLQEVLQHLIQNAEQAMVASHGGGTLSIRVRPAAGAARIEVADDGPGISQQDLPRIFNPFFTTKEPGQGRGLGLSVVHSVIAEHGGRLWVENRPEGGAIFVLELPVRSSSETPTPTPAPTGRR
jgi:C4-dicarboxylate-specific signal transduction histidine kinase